MLDYWKLWVYDAALTAQVLQNKTVGKCFRSDEEGVLKGISGNFGEWQIQTLPGCLQITGSIHKYWNGGTNENDFSFADVGRAINRFCSSMQLPPEQLFVKNLEFGLNLQPPINASRFMDQIICYNYRQPLRPYTTRPDCYFIEFEQSDYYLKVYDKGKQYSRKLPGTPNTLRLEIKAMNSGYLKALGIATVADLTKPDTLQVLGWKIAKLAKGIVLDDDTINPKELPQKERQLYRYWNNPRKWAAIKGRTTTTRRNHANRFRRIVQQYGSRKMYSLLNGLIADKIRQLSTPANVAVFQSNLYLEKRQNRVCATCGRDITGQHPKSRFCSAKVVGYQQAHKCRNGNSNPRNNLKRKVAAINRKGVLFDVTPYIMRRAG